MNWGRRGPMGRRVMMQTTPSEAKLEPQDGRCATRRARPFFVWGFRCLVCRGFPVRLSDSAHNARPAFETGPALLAGARLRRRAYRAGAAE